MWLNPSKANNTYAFALRKDDAAAKGIKSLSDLAAKVKGGQNLKFACNAEFYARPDGLGPLQKTYGFEFSRDNVVRMDTGLVYQALRDKQVDVGLVFATDGRIPAFDFVVLTDDKGYFPNYALTPVVRKAALDKNPKIADVLNELSAKLDDQVMAKLNARIDVEKKTVEDVAAGFLKEEKLFDPTPARERGIGAVLRPPLAMTGKPCRRCRNRASRRRRRRSRPFSAICRPISASISTRSPLPARPDTMPWCFPNSRW